MKVLVERQHDLGIDEIKSRVDEQIAVAKASYGHLVSSYDWHWVDAILIGKVEAYGATCNAQTEVGETSIRVEINFPFVMLPLKNKIIEMLEFRLNRICSRQRH